MYKVCLLSIVTSIFLSGCGLIFGPMEDRIDATNAEVRKTNANITGMRHDTVELLKTSVTQLSDMERIQILGGATEMASDTDRSTNIRIRKAQVMFVVADIDKEDQIWEDLGALAPVKVPDHDLEIEGLRNVRNVCYVDDTLKDTVSEDMLQIYTLASKKMLKKLLGALPAPKDTSAARVAYESLLRERAYQLVYIGTVVMGSANGIANTAKPPFPTPARDDQFRESHEDRAAFAKGLRELHNSLVMATKGKTISKETLEALIETRLGLPREQN